MGLLRLPGLDEYEIAAAASRPGSYDHLPPWPAAGITDETLDLEDEPDIDPDDIDEWDVSPDAGPEDDSSE